VSVLDIRREFHGVIKKPSKDVQEVIDIKWREVDLYQIKIGKVDEKMASYVG